jgi:DNA polymerase-3 subunit gamma/tau
LAICKDARTIDLLDVSATFRQKYAEQSAALSFSFILNGLNMLNDCDEKYRNSQHPRLLVELTLMKLSNLNNYLKGIVAGAELKKKALN